MPLDDSAWVGNSGKDMDDCKCSSPYAANKSQLLGWNVRQKMPDQIMTSLSWLSRIGKLGEWQ